MQVAATNSERQRALLLLVADLEKLSTSAQWTPTAMTATAFFSRARNISSSNPFTQHVSHGIRFADFTQLHRIAGCPPRGSVML